VSRPRILGAVLAGGRSTRFGSDKADALLRGLSLAERAADAIAIFADETATVGGPARHGLAVLPDRPRPGLGPLGGVAGALLHARARGLDAVLTIACDTPSLPDGLAEALVRRGPSYCEHAPTLGYWPVDLADGLLAWLDKGGDRSLCRWAASIGALPIRVAGPVPNVNTPEDLAALA